MNAARLALVALLMAAHPATAQQGPFDMSPEQAEKPQVDPATPAPSGIQPPQPQAAAPVEAQPTALRYLLPSGDFVLSGENTTRSWSFYLTPQEAKSPATLNFGYQNAVIVAPEASWMRLVINGRKLFDMPIASSDKVSEITVTPPVGLLRAGVNDIRIESAQRHRTDCTIASTYELWTQIKPERTFLSFAADDASTWKRVEDMRAIGVDASGNTTVNLVVPGIGQAAATTSVMRLAQGLALMANMPNQSFTVSEDASAARGPGVATVMVGTASELRGLLPKLPDGAETAPTAGLAPDAPSGRGTLVVTGPTWDAVGTAIASIVAPLDRKLGVQRSAIATGSWRTPDAPLLLSASRLTLADLGVVTQEFSGRRFRTDFAIGLPADFYANAYGEANLLLDAAYTADVLPGSHVDIYVNDDIAATVPITANDGEIWRHLPIKVTMRHFKPGQNRIGIEAVLLTNVDNVCAPGATALPGVRFALFDTSEFVMPDYARIGQTPNLAALGGNGYPYNVADAPVALVVDRSALPSYSAAATLLARMAVAAGRVIAIDASVSTASASAGNGIFVGPISQIPPAVLDQVGIGAAAATSWGENVVASDDSASPDTVATLDVWRDRVGGDGWRGRVQALTDWLSETFKFSPGTLRLIPGRDEAFSPGGNASLMVAQQASPTGRGSWTLFTAPTPQALVDGMQAVTTQANWQKLGGHITTYDATSTTLSQVPIGRSSFVATQPASLSNYRLIVANWVSSNTLSYAMLLALLCTLLGFATYGLLGRFGRKP